MRKKCCYGRRRTWGQYSSLSPSPTHLSHTETSTLSKIKCERYIFIKKCVRSFIVDRILRLIMFPHIFVYVYVQMYHGYTTHGVKPTKYVCSNLLSVLLSSAQGRMKGAPKETRTQTWSFANHYTTWVCMYVDIITWYTNILLRSFHQPSFSRKSPVGIEVRRCVRIWPNKNIHLHIYSCVAGVSS